MPMQDLRTHLDKYFAVMPMPNLGKTTGTICDKRRASEFVTNDVTQVTCQECVTAAGIELNKWLDTSLRLLEVARENQNAEHIGTATLAIASLQQKINALPGSGTL